MADKRLDMCLKEKMNISRQKAQELIENNFQVYDIKQKQYRNIKYK